MRGVTMFSPAAPSFIQTLILTVTVSIDGLIAGMAYGARGISVRFSSYLLTGILSGGLAGLVRAAASSLSFAILGTKTATWVGGSTLVTLGCLNILRVLRGRSHQQAPEESQIILRWRIRALRLVLEVAREPLSADADGSGEIDLVEAAALGVALGLDAALLGAASCLMEETWFLVPMIGVACPAFLYLGIVTGRRGISARISGSPWTRLLPGVALVVIGLLRIIRP
ncbi:MAG TPA: hypothetical protein GX510_01135 [Firmicutes bacterium]|nr:hypothetical protein [Candidatus Fermentithermobacillaceae bacterium]